MKAIMSEITDPIVIYFQKVEVLSLCLNCYLGIFLIVSSIQDALKDLWLNSAEQIDFQVANVRQNKIS